MQCFSYLCFDFSGVTHNVQTATITQNILNEILNFCYINKEDLLKLISWRNQDQLLAWSIEGSSGTKIAPWQVFTNTDEMPLKGNKSFQ